MSVHIGNILRSLVRKYGLEKALHQERMPEYWADVVGPRIARISDIRSFENGVLKVFIAQPAWRTEVTLRRGDIRQQLNTRIGEDLVKEIIIR